MPFAIGAQAGGVDIEPFTTIKSFNPLVYYRMGEASGSLINSGSSASRDITTTNLAYNQSTKPANRSPLGSISFNGTTTTAETTAGVIGGFNPTFSIGCWIWTTDASGIDTLIAQRDGSQGFRFYIDSGSYLGFVGTPTTGPNDFSFLSEQLNDLNDGLPHYVSATVLSDNVLIYCDGAEVGNWGGRTGGTWSATPKIFLGQSFGPADRYTGFMSDAFITSQVLTQQDHHRIWRSGRLHAATPTGDNFLDAVEISVPVAETTIAAFSLANNTIEPNEPGGEPYEPGGVGILDTNKSQWFKMTSTVAGDRIRFTGDANNPAFAYHYIDIFKDTDGTIGGLELETTVIGYNTVATHIVEANTTYYIRVRSYNMSVSTFNNLLYEYDTPPPPPANDNFANATTLNVATGGNIAGTTAESTIEDPDETYWGSGDPYSVWYKFQADATGNITLDTDLSSPADTVIEVWEGSPTIANFAAIPDLQTPDFADDDGGTSGASLLTFAVTSGNWYYVMINDYDSGTAFTLRWSDIT